MAGFHFLQRVDFDGRTCGLEVYQWQPNAKKWCRCNEYASDRDLVLEDYVYDSPCPLPISLRDLKEKGDYLDGLFTAAGAFLSESFIEEWKAYQTLVKENILP
jgi:hypothetical protein